MTLDTSYGIPVDSRMLNNYLYSLVGRFFKILPIREEESETLVPYMESLLVELLGCSELILNIRFDARFLSLVGTLQYLIDNPNETVDVYKREVFNSISICNKLKKQYAVKKRERVMG